MPKEAQFIVQLEIIGSFDNLKKLIFYWFYVYE